MTTGTSTYGDINQRTAAWAATDMLRHAEPVLVLQKFGETKEVPKNKAQTVKWRRPIPFPAATTPLQEGATPTAQKMQYEDVEATLKQYGKPIEITDVVMDLAEDPVMSDANMLAGEQAALTNEMIIWGVLKGGTNVHYANGAARNAVNVAITKNKQRRVTRGLNAQKAMKISRMMSGSPNFRTAPIGSAYVAVAHTDCEADIRNLAKFVPVEEYGTKSMLCEQEIGACESVRYVCSPELNPIADAGGSFSGSGTNMLTTSGTSADVYPIIYIGKESYGNVPLKGKRAITPMVVNPKPSDSDPLGQRGHVSWKAYFTAVRLNENWMSRLEVAVTDL